MKSYLKAARDHMTAGNSQEALKCCKAALKIDNNSYEALVFAGKASFALGDFDSAAAGYRRASQTNPAALPAWQVSRCFGARKPTTLHTRRPFISSDGVS